MSPSPALLRAQVGVVLRGRRTELQPAGAGVPYGLRVAASAERFARDLEQMAPGLALVLQLRARLYDDATTAAPRRGIRRLVAIGCALDDRRLEAARASLDWVGDVDHPDVLAVKSPSRAGVVRIGVEDLEGGSWAALAAARAMPGDARTLFFVQNPSFWSVGPPLARWLPEFAARAGDGSEVLLNLIGPHGGALHGGVGAVVPPSAGTGDAVPLVRSQLEELGLRLLAACDSRTLQQQYLGNDDLLATESYLWIAKNPSPERASPPAGRLALLAGWHSSGPRERAATAPLAEDAKPRMRPDVLVRRGALLRTVTPLRYVGVVLEHDALAAARRLDGTCTLADLAGASEQIHDIAATCWRAGLLEDPPAASTDRQYDSLKSVGGAVLDALVRRDVSEAQRLAPQLIPFAGNRAARHLRSVAATCSPDDVVLVGAAPVFVLAPRTTAIPASEIAIGAREVLEQVASIVGCVRAPRVLVDVCNARAGMPRTHVEVDEPYTLVEIPAAACSRSVLAHELTHVVANARSLWLSEGLAVWMQRSVAPGRCYPDDGTDEASGNGASATGVPSLARLLREPIVASPSPEHSERPSRRAYRQGARFVTFMVERFGLEGFLRLFRACTHAGSDDAIAEACRYLGCGSLSGLERLWRHAERVRA